MFQRLKNRGSHGKKRLAHRRRFCVENLERRELMAADMGLSLEPLECQSAASAAVQTNATMSLETVTPAGSRVANSHSSVPSYSSKPGAKATIYLDFNGHYQSSWGRYSPAYTPAYDTDGSPASFNSSERSDIYQIWSRVAEDFAPFDVNVTTVNPGSFGNKEAVRVVIGGNGSWYGDAGGVAYVGSFYNSMPNVVFVFEDKLGSAKSIAEASSHEAGHAFGLEHQSRWSGSTKTQEYYTGYNTSYGGWAPIMGNSYSNSLTTWSYGKNADGKMQSDMSVIASSKNGFGYRTDDHGGSTSTATQLGAGRFVYDTGIIEKTSDVDYFSFSTGSGRITFKVDGARYGQNLDAKLELRNKFGTLIATASPSSSLDAELTATVSSGEYYIVVKSNGVYGRVGQYTLTGNIVNQANIAFSNGTVTVQGTNSRDLIDIGYSGVFGSWVQVRVRNQFGTVVAQEHYSRYAVSRINVFALGGDDYVTNSTSIRDYIFAGTGNDTVLAGYGNSYVQGWKGDDYLSGRRGNDSIFGNQGADTLLGGDHDDYLDGGNYRQSDGKRDYVYGGSGTDRSVDYVWRIAWWSIHEDSLNSIESKITEFV